MEERLRALNDVEKLEKLSGLSSAVSIFILIDRFSVSISLTDISCLIQELIQGLRDGSIKSLDAVRAFTLAAIQVDREINCVTEVLRQSQGSRYTEI